ncbi:MAG TPA: histidine kinase [Ohtaekwangia sp.]|uniref:sensor histidine kinase n=1 Tax=Ohtaekwangia sp. TaxID=2066019 RepID=UPI002F95C7DE
MMARKNYLAWHIIGCIVFLALPIFLFPHPPEEKDFILSRPTQRDFIGNGIMLLIFYLNFFLLIPRLYFKQRYILYAFCIIAGFFIITLLPSFVTGHNPFSKPLSLASPPAQGHQPVMPKPEGFTFMEEIRHHIFLYVAVILFSVLLRVRNRLYRTEMARNHAEIISLKMQINPHFLFNTLNNIYAFAVREKAPGTASSILKLSGLMRYVVTETGNGFVTLEKEISYINDYVELQRMRLDKRVELSYSVTGSTNQQLIAPLVLIPFIENAFKHGVNPDEESSINIAIAIDEKMLKLVVENNKVKVAQDPHTKSGHGIENTKARLQLLYPDRHSLILSEDEKHFRVQLTIDLK